MKAKQSGGPAKLVHRCFVAYAVLAISAANVLAETPQSLDDYAQIYVDQYFAPDARLQLSEEAKRKSGALAHFVVGRMLELQGLPDEAVDSYSEVLRQQPDQFFLARKTAYLLARAGREDEARQLLEESFARNPEEPSVHIALSEFLATYGGGDPATLQRAIEIVEQAVAQFPDNAAVYEHLVKLFLSADRGDDARKIVEDAANRPNRDPEFWLRLGRTAARVWRLGENGEVTDQDLVNRIHLKALEVAGGRRPVLERLGDFFHATGQFDRAIVAYRDILAKDPGALDIREKVARVYGAQGNEEKVLETLKEIAEIDPESPDVHKQIAGIHLRREQFTEAIPYLRKALSITKGSAEEYGALARMMIETKEFDTAISFLKETAYLFPDSPDFPFLLTFPLAIQEKWDESVKEFEKALKLAGEKHPQLLNERFYYRYAAAYERGGNLEKAEELFRKTIELIAKNDLGDEDQDFTATVYNYLGYMWLENDMKIDEAGELIKTAVQLSPESGAIADSLGWFYFKKGKFEAARDELLRAESLIEEQDAVIFDHIAQAFHQLGEKDRAIEYLEKALAMDPGNEEFTKRLADYRNLPAKAADAPAPEGGKAEPAAPASPVSDSSEAKAVPGA
ncbi:MAG TPA: tetratricopeptide repeat protein, partial [Bacteroidia bacterium]|nr:tetratricopeptide repeat protein [Bacteroidia bacterium]